MTSIAATDPDAPLAALQNRMREAERELAVELAGHEHVVVLDGPLNFVVGRDSRVAGYVKSHHRAFLPAELHARVPRIGVGERTSLFAIGERYSFYLRIAAPGPQAGPWSGIVRLQAEAVARQTLALAHDALREAADLDARLHSLEPLARALDALHAALGDGKFKRFVAARKEQRLLGIATTILGRMTDERYGFGPAMRIVDRSAGQERSPQTLSGGEKFLASLALAFALVEIAARSGGHFGALFLDEGFGSLDVRALDAALSELERQAAGGRMIGVITHVREVSEYIDDVLRVWRTPAGSDVARLGRADLDALVAQTATLAIGSV